MGPLSPRVTCPQFPISSLHRLSALPPSWRSPTHANQPLNSNHPGSTLVQFIRMDLHLQSRGCLEVPSLERSCQFDHHLHRVRLEQVLTIQMVEELAEPLLGVVNLGLESRGRACLDSGQFRRQDCADGLCFYRDMGAVACS